MHESCSNGAKAVFAHGGAGGVPIAAPRDCGHVVSTNVKWALLMISWRASNSASFGTLDNASDCKINLRVLRRAAAVGMLVCTLAAAAVKSNALCGNCCCRSCNLSSHELFKGAGCA